MSTARPFRIVSISLFVAGCSAEIGSRGAVGSVSMTLQGGDEFLTLDQAPDNPSYQASYPNPRVLFDMQVTLYPTGQLEGVCTDATGPVPCGDVPFFSRAQRVPDGWAATAWDMFGTQVATVMMQGAPSGADGPSENQQSPADVGGSGGCDSPPADCTAQVDWARECFCTGVNGNLEALGIDHQVDCGALSTPLEDRTFDDSVEPQYHGPISCGHDILRPAEELVDEMLSADCRDAEVAVNNAYSEIHREFRDQEVCGHSPLVLDLAGDGISLTTLDGGTMFDLLGDGVPTRCAWTQGDDALLVLDRDADGTIDGAAELFGNSTAGRSFADGFAALDELDANRDGRVDAQDPRFRGLEAWNDSDRDGVADPGERRSLGDVGVTTLLLQPVRVDGLAQWDGRGNRIPLRSELLRADGSRSALVDAFLSYEAR